jgi:quercetin dioxygenase-like cupin family protein
MVYILDGMAEITIGDEKFTVKEGETIIMPANVPHALYAAERFKMLLTVVFSLE